MICLECVNGLTREFPGDRRETTCCMDGKVMMAVTKCNMFFRAVDDKPIVESVMPDLKFQSEVVDLGYGAVPDLSLNKKLGQGIEVREVPRETISEVLKRGRGRPRKA